MSPAVLGKWSYDVFSKGCWELDDSHDYQSCSTCHHQLVLNLKNSPLVILGLYSRIVLSKAGMQDKHLQSFWKRSKHILRNCLYDCIILVSYQFLEWGIKSLVVTLKEHFVSYFLELFTEVVLMLEDDKFQWKLTCTDTWGWYNQWKLTYTDAWG